MKWTSGSLLGVREEATEGMQYFKKTHSNEAFFGRIFYLGVRERDTSLIWGCAVGYNFDLGVPKYQKVENP
jgi:hypothetical protein